MEDLAKLYAILDLEPSATSEEIKIAYIDLVKVWHPDRYAQESARLRAKAERKLKDINQAYDRLRGATTAGSAETSDSSAPVELFAYDFGSRWGYVNREGKLLIPAKYDAASQFAEGLACVREGSLHGYIDGNGFYKIHPQFHSARSFSEGLAAVVFSVKWGFINRLDQFVVTPLYEDAGDFAEGVAPVKWHGRWGYIDRTGSFTIAPRFDDAHKFAGGQASVRIGEKWGRVMPTGEVFFAGQRGELE